MKKTLMSIFSITLALFMILVSVPVCTATDYVPVKVGEEISVTNVDEMWFTFTPEVSGVYTLFTEGDIRTLGSIFGKDQHIDSHEGEKSGEGFCMTLTLEAGVEYEIVIRNSDINNGTIKRGTYVFKIDLIYCLEDAVLTAEKTIGYQGEPLKLEVMPIPSDTTVDRIDWSVDENKATIALAEEDYAVVVMKEVGPVEVRATVNNKVELSITLNCIMTPKMTVDECCKINAPAEGFCYRIFTPDEDGLYTVYSTGEADSYAVLADIDGNELVSDDDSGEGYNFALQYELSKGTDYVIAMSDYDGSGASYDVVIKKSKKATAVNIEANSALYGYITQYVSLSCVFDPVYGEFEELEWSTSNKKVAVVESYKNECYVKLVGTGKASIIVTTASGLSDRITVECLPTVKMDIGDTVKVSHSNDGVPTMIEIDIEKTGYYMLHSTGGCDTQAYLGELTSNKDFNVYARNDNHVEGDNFSMCVEMYAGITYYLEISCLSDDCEHEYYVTFDNCIDKADALVLETYEMPETLHVGDTFYLSAEYRPVGVNSDKYPSFSWSCDSDEVLGFSKLNNGYYWVVCLKEGTATVNVTNNKGLSASMTFVVEKAVVYGDVNMDNEINAKDSNVLKRYIAGETVEIDRYSADINKDEKIDAKDANLLKQILSGSVEA